MSHRTQRLAEAIREVVSKAVLFEVADPRVRAVTVLRTEVSGDNRNATVFVSIMGTPAEQRTAMQGLQSAAGFLQARVANRLQIRFTPILSFKLDDSVKRSVEMSKLIEDALAADRKNHPETAPATSDHDKTDDDADETDDDADETDDDADETDDETS
jgi:ribosome-binding factor A